MMTSTNLDLSLNFIFIYTILNFFTSCCLLRPCLPVFLMSLNDTIVCSYPSQTSESYCPLFYSTSPQRPSSLYFDLFFPPCLLVLPLFKTAQVFSPSSSYTVERPPLGFHLYVGLLRDPLEEAQALSVSQTHTAVVWHELQKMSSGLTCIPPFPTEVYFWPLQIFYFLAR